MPIFTPVPLYIYITHIPRQHFLTPTVNIYHINQRKFAFVLKPIMVFAIANYLFIEYGQAEPGEGVLSPDFCLKQPKCNVLKIARLHNTKKRKEIYL